MSEEGARPFDLERGPMIRVTLLRVSDAEHAMVITTHHIATDGWSMPMVYGDLLSFYEAFREGRSLELPEPPLRYERIAGASHWMQLDKPEEINALLLEFLA